MASWHRVESQAPEFAARVRGRFDAGTNKTLATLRGDGAPRISAVEAAFTDGEVTLGMMAGSVKLADVRRDTRVALHCPTVEPPTDARNWSGDAKLAGRLIELPAPDDDPGSGRFRLEVSEVTLTSVGGDPPDHLVIESWTPAAGYRRRVRR